MKKDKFIEDLDRTVRDIIISISCVFLLGIIVGFIIGRITS